MPTLRRTALAVPLLGLAWAGPACAHAILLESTPAAHAVIAPGPLHMVLKFNSRIDAGRSRVELRGADAPALSGGKAPGPDTMAADATLVPGDYVVRWQVLAVDGHITRGDVPFTVKAP